MSKADPLLKLEAFARRLGWGRLKRYRHTVQGSIDPREDGTIIEWYEAGKWERAFLQINTNPWRAAVYAIRYRLCSGWYEFRFPNFTRMAESEAERLQSYLAARWFRTPTTRRKYRLMHPECTGWTWKRIREREQPPQHGLPTANSAKSRPRGKGK